ncbi:hypothetical protein DFP73DRAFT_549515 [Morchella snyderi]|nr:hypothetical protein DFP73DRAFT_549515 [Morchella snyderi]
MTDNNKNQKRKAKWTTSYSNMSPLDAEDRLGFRMNTIKAVSVQRMLRDANYTLEGEDSILMTKEKVYNRILEYLIMEGYPTEANTYFKETNVNDLVLYTIGPIITDFILKTGRDSIQLLREKEIVSKDSETGGYEEFVMMDLISVKERNYVLIIEAKKSSLGDAMKQCLLSMKDARDNNGGGEVYGFVTTGESWQMLKYDGTSFQLSGKMDVVFPWMDEDKELWMKDYSVLVDCMYAALSSGGIVQND